MNNSKKGAVKTSNSKKKKKVVKKKRVRIKYKNLLLVIIFVMLFYFGAIMLLKVQINNIIVKGNVVFSDQKIIDVAGIREYPSTLKTSSSKIKKKLEKDVYIKSAKISKKNFLTKVVIEVEENQPVFFYQPYNKTVLEDGSLVEETFSVPTVINQIPDSVYDKFLKKMSKVPSEVLAKISEIRYTPNDVDAELFFMTMSDGNYVYITIYKFERIYNYIQYVESFNNKKGILHLDSGDYLEVMEGN